MNKYQLGKQRVRDMAVEFSHGLPERYDMSYGEWAAWQELFFRLGKRYGLLTEFHENGIC